GFDLFAAEGADGLAGLDVHLPVARSGDLDGVEGGGLLARVQRERDAGAGDAVGARYERVGDRFAKSGGLQTHLFLQVSLGIPWEPHLQARRQSRQGGSIVKGKREKLKLF